MRLVNFIAVLFLCVMAHAAEPWSIVQVGDIHAGMGQTTSNDWWTFKNFVLTHTNDGVFNINAVTTCGDVYEQDFPVSSLASNVFTDLTAFRNAGVFTFMCPGNHDADDPTAAANGTRVCDPGAEWNAFFPTNWFTNYTGYKGTRLVNDTKNVAVTWTNRGQKFIFVSIAWATNLFGPPYNVPAAYLAQVQWATNILGQYRDHLGVVLCHYMIATNRQFEYWDTGLTLYSNIGLSQAAWDGGLGNASNLFLVLAGHNRVPLKIHRFFKTPSGNWGVVHQWNSQNYTNYTQKFALITFIPDAQTVLFRSYDIQSGTWFTNGQTSYFGPTPKQWTHNWSLPIPVLSSPPIRAFRLPTPP